MKKFMYLFKGGDSSESPEEMQANMQEWMTWIDELTKKNVYLSGEPLEPGGRIMETPDLITDGPFPEAKELIGGYFIVQTEDMDSACEIAKDCPIFKLNGSVIVRPVMNMDM